MIGRKPRLRVADLPAWVKGTPMARELSSQSWAEMPRDGDGAIYFGNAGEKLVVNAYSLLLMKQYPRIGPGYHPACKWTVPL